MGKKDETPDDIPEELQVAINAFVDKPKALENCKERIELIRDYLDLKDQCFDEDIRARDKRDE